MGQRKKEKIEQNNKAKKWKKEKKLKWKTTQHI